MGGFLGNISLKIKEGEGKERLASEIKELFCVFYFVEFWVFLLKFRDDEKSKMYSWLDWKDTREIVIIN